MSYQKRKLLNQLHRHLPEGLIADAAWFSRMGYASSLRSRYVASGWLQTVVRGVFRHPLHAPGLDEAVSPLHWQHTLVSLQLVMERPIAVGGRTALELHGFTHFPSRDGPREIHLYGEEKAPGWLGKLPLATPIIFHNACKLFCSGPIGNAVVELKSTIAANKSGYENSVHAGLTWGRFDVGNWPIILSTAERAILELLDELPGGESFGQVDALMDGLVSLSPKRMNYLLKECRSVKVKRLFLWFADRHGHPWLEHIDRKSIDLGKGKRMLVRGGKLDSKYLITVPEDLYSHG